MSPWVLRLIVANVVVYALQQLYPVLAQYGAFSPQTAFKYPWSIVTYMFLHAQNMPTHLIFNMIGIYFFGSRVEERMGSKHFILMYFAAGIAGALFSFVLSPNASIIGASGGVFGIMMCFASFWPRQQIHIWGVIPIEAWLLVGLTTLFALYSGLTGTSAGTAHYAHLGGYVGAYLYLLVLERNSASRKFRAKLEKVAPTTEKVIKQNWKNVNLDGVHQLSREEVNRILDKINAEGIGSLTTEEKLFLSNFVPPDDRKSWAQ